MIAISSDRRWTRERVQVIREIFAGDLKPTMLFSPHQVD
jgi:hypothetical protein